MRRQLCHIFIIMILLSSCSLQEDHSSYPYSSKAEKEQLEKFLRYLLFWERGVYTLLGSKPITVFDVFELDDSFKLDPSLFQFPNFKIYLNKDRKEDVELYKSLDKSEKVKVVLLSDRDYVFDGMALMRVWDKFEPKVKISQNYILIKREYTSEEKKELVPGCTNAYHIVFVNVLKTACLLKERYSTFEKIFGENFDPIEEVLRIKEMESPLWSILHSTSPEKYYQEVGLLLGCGEEASQVFEWKNNEHNPSKSFFDGVYEKSIDDLENVFQKPRPLTAQNFPLPTFVSYFIGDPMKRKYELERKDIMSFYSDRDFLETTLDVLTGK